MPQRFLPYSRQTLDEDDVAAVVSVLRGDWLTTGPAVEQFESALAASVQARHAVACSSGTAALHLAMLALGMGPGDAVVVPSMTFLATANAVRLVGGEVVFADVDEATGLLTPGTLTEALSRVPSGLRLRAVVPVHLRGLPCDMRAIADVARAHGLDIVEDAAHALGTRYEDGGSIAVGACRSSRMACFSFHPIKAITTGEGGAVTTNDPELFLALKSMRSHGMVRDPERWTNREAGGPATKPNPWYYEMQALAPNYRITDIQCALGASQLQKLPHFISRRAELAERYDRLLPDLAPIVRPHASRPATSPAWHLYSPRIDFRSAGVSRRTLMKRLHARGIGTQVNYIPVHMQPYYRARYGDLDLPGSRRYYEQTLSLPLYPALALEDIDRVVAELGAALRP